MAKDVRDDREALKELLELGYASTPVIVIDGQQIAGFDTEAIDRALEKSASCVFRIS